MDLNIAFGSQNIFLFHLYGALNQEIYNEDAHPSARSTYNLLFFFSMLDHCASFTQSVALLSF